MAYPELVATFLVACFAFITTNLDEILVLILLFSSGKYSAVQIALGFYAGIAVAVIASLLASVFSLFMPEYIVGFIGLIPVLIGIKSFINQIHGSDFEDVGEIKSALKKSAVGVASVFLLTVANCGDNFGVYTALFAAASARTIIIYIIVFVVFTALLCIAASSLTRSLRTGRRIALVGEALFPFLVIAIGLYVMVECGTLLWILEKLI
ncbi:MAG: cadmium resistance transporter [Thermoplasmata archaeon]